MQRTPPARVVNLSALSLLERFQHLVDSKARGLGTWRILLEGCDEVPDIPLGRQQRPGALDQPVVVTHGQQIAIIGEMGELLSRPLLYLAGKVGQEIIAVEVDLEVIAIGLIAR